MTCPRNARCSVPRRGHRRREDGAEGRPQRVAVFLADGEDLLTQSARHPRASPMNRRFHAANILTKARLNGPRGKPISSARCDGLELPPLRLERARPSRADAGRAMRDTAIGSFGRGQKGDTVWSGGRARKPAMPRSRCHWPPRSGRIELLPPDARLHLRLEPRVDVLLGPSREALDEPPIVAHAAVHEPVGPDGDQRGQHLRARAEPRRSCSARRWSAWTAGAAYPACTDARRRSIRAVSSARSRSADSLIESSSSRARERRVAASTCAPRPCSF